MADSSRQKLRIQGRALLTTKTVNQQKLYASRRIVVSGIFVILTGILQAAKMGNFKCLPAQSFVRYHTF
jgi:hypothetical protein